MYFEWDPKKAKSNFAKHRVGFEEAATIFGDRLSITILDSDHSSDERRFISVGLSAQGRILVVAHTDRGDKIRIISSRLASKRERKIYEEET